MLSSKSMDSSEFLHPRNHDLTGRMEWTKTGFDFILLTWFREKTTLLGGLEPPTFRLTAERANQLRHKSCDNRILFRIWGRKVPGRIRLRLQAYKMKESRNQEWKQRLNFLVFLILFQLWTWPKHCLSPLIQSGTMSLVGKQVFLFIPTTICLLFILSLRRSIRCSIWISTETMGQWNVSENNIGTTSFCLTLLFNVVKPTLHRADWWLILYGLYGV